MTITATEFKTRFPEFSCEPDPRVELFIADSVSMLNSVYWANKYDLGLHYLTAHYLILATESKDESQGSVGMVSGKSVDGVSVSYAVPAVGLSDAFYASTVYGQRYLTLRKSLGVAANVI